ncbi:MULTISPECIES: glycosyltransferase [Citrobacter]|uniref:glycosyltransferase n=1 Tax=Citrobacter TaxID=544 RepID=UPI00336ABF4E
MERIIEVKRKVMKNICLVATSLGMGGAEKQVCDLANSFYKKGHNVTILCLNNSILNKPMSDDIKIHTLCLEKNMLSFCRSLLLARTILKEFKPDIVHSHMFHANIFSRFLRLIYPFPVLISTAHNTNEGGRLRMFLYRITDFLATISTNVSHEAVQSFINKGAVKEGRMLAFYNGIDTNTFKFSQESRNNKRKELNLKEDDVLLLAVGRLTEAKNYKNMLNALRSVIAQKVVHLAIIGTGPDGQELHSYAEKIGVSKYVHWLGIRFDVKEWMSAMDLYIMSSSWEGMPLVICEAMSCEGLVVATDCGGVKEIIGDAGYIVPTNNPDALSNTILSALELTTLKRRYLVSAARERIEKKYSLDNIANKWLEFYETVKNK